MQHVVKLDFVFVQQIYNNVYSNSFPGMDNDLCCLTILNKTMTKMNTKRWNCSRCHVLSDCDKRIWIVIDDSIWKITKLIGQYAKMIDQRQNWNKIWHIPGFSGRNWSINLLNWMITCWKLMGNLYCPTLEKGSKWHTI